METLHLNVEETALSSTLALGGAAFTGAANAALTSSATLDFTLGTAQTMACTLSTMPPCNKASYRITDIVGSYFAMDQNDKLAEPGEKTGIASFFVCTV